MEIIKKYGFDDMGGQIIDQYGKYKRNKKDINNKIEYDSEIYILIENITGFYNRALIYQNEKNNNKYILMSYDTIVAEYNGNYFDLFGYYSRTTAKHINYFLQKFGFDKLSKKEIENTKQLFYK